MNCNNNFNHSKIYFYIGSYVEKTITNLLVIQNIFTKNTIKYYFRWMYLILNSVIICKVLPIKSSSSKYFYLRIINI